MKPPAWWPLVMKQLIVISIVLLSMAALWHFGVDTGPVVQEPTWTADYTLLGTITEIFTYPSQGTEISYYFKMRCDNDTHFIKTSWNEYAKWHVNDTYRFWGKQIVNDPRPAPYRGEWDVILTNPGKNVFICGDSVLFTVGYNRTTGEIGDLNISFIVNIARYDTSVQDAVTVLSVEDVGQITIDNITYEMIRKNPDGTYKANWTDTGNHTFNMSIILPENPSDRTATATLNIQLDHVVIQKMADYDMSVIMLKVAHGYVWINTILLPQ